jgi:hypothetical protein
LVGAGFAERKCVACIGDGARGETAVARIAGEQRRIAEIFAAGQTIGTMAAGVAEPRDADTHADAQPLDADRIDAANDFMARNNWQFRIWQFAVDDVQIGTADAAGGDLYSNLARTGFGVREFLPDERPADLFQDHCIHEVVLLRGLFGLPAML